MAAAPPTAPPPADVPAGSIGPVEERELPQAPALRRIVGPGIVLVGVGIASGEYILYPLMSVSPGAG